MITITDTITIAIITITTSAKSGNGILSILSILKVFESQVWV